MKTMMGAVVVAVGVLLMVYGLDADQCLSARVSNVLHTSPGAKSIYFLCGGVLAVLVGMSLSYSRRPHTKI
jgi:hypothetical protein